MTKKRTKLQELKAESAFWKERAEFFQGRCAYLEGRILELEGIKKTAARQKALYELQKKELDRLIDIEEKYLALIAWM